MFTKALVQAIGVLIFSAIVGLGINALRPDGVPLVHAEESAVKLDNSNGEVSIKDAAMLFISQRAVFLDARSRMEFDAGHIQHALSFPVEELDFVFEELAPKLKDAETIITYCDGERCPLSHELAQNLRARGFDNVYVLKNGWTLWQNEKLPVETGEGNRL
ncbi:MAG: rhodanese-like domain-containing protein [Pseudodesulfovibrio sp.]|uniref:rhodanese-like domain-containing protein n=1 Tax=Pseudodesulfovibrio sp. TaxID=2035812 RepID=UPI003D09F91B